MFRSFAVTLLVVLILLSACGTPTDNSTASQPYGSAVSTTAPAPVSDTPASPPGAANATPASGGASTDPSSGTKKQYSAPPKMQIDPNKTYMAVIDTTKGKLTVELYAKDAPLTVNNFVFLARDGFYRNVKFHRIMKNFMDQTGDPLGTGTGGPGYNFKDEPVTREYTRGTLAMANSGANTNGSQFFIMNQDYPLDKNYTIFGKVTDGLATVDAIANTPVTAGAGGEQSSPTEDVRIKDITITEK
ncbi:MAG: peptidylprolyl isomerase [Herpetosiphonaceae bacterium]|nr:peptidylprolyl isomerase [Herpetosiphonaceae bacterium]